MAISSNCVSTPKNLFQGEFILLAQVLGHIFDDVTNTKSLRGSWNFWNGVGMLPYRTYNKNPCQMSAGTEVYAGQTFA